ncbi:DUF4861 family protein [Pedobacter nyackensis]|uniref:DUF4861 domain-containing protein n=1 Tax=Pedobacter nyackensis TaxID=475255 RepID=A0A1W2CQ67_9SPHI|nr:DUF4861 family protein [Pedobacter nyackensis]SMC87126.1 protein of unknown function [Pedobacter nyackensis]
MKIFGFLLLFPALYAPVMAQTKATITVSNPSKLERTNAVVPVNWSSVTAKYPAIDTANFKVVNSLTKKEVPFQLERRGEATVKNLLVQVSLKANGSAKLLIVPGKPAAVVKKTYGRYVPERYDDFAWENDKVAFRMYGKALETRKDNAFGTDVWVKRTNKLVINEWYKTGDYHTDHGDGMDYYSVGFTLGAGDVAPIIKDSIVFAKNYHYWKVLDNGPLRTTFELGYDAWDVAGKSVKVTKTISLDAGSHMNRVEALYTYSGDVLPVAVGIVKRKEPGTILMDEQQGIVGYWEPQHGADGTTGVGTIVLGENLSMGTDVKHLLTRASATNNKPFVYYNGSAWSKANEITNAQSWFNYLSNFKNQLQQPLKVSVL